MVRIEEKDINEVRNRADIVSVISRYIPVQKQGKSYKAVCPFHNDHDPSLSISPDKQIYKCFVCGAGGNVISFVQNFEKISFQESVVQVADLVGYKLNVDTTSSQKEIDPHKQALYKVLDETIRYTMYELNSTSGEKEREYLEKRGLDASIREKFGIGFNPYNNAVTNFLKAKGYKDQDIVSTNIGRITDNGIKDVFEGRITFPIHDAYGNPIGFSARTLVKDISKYINTNDTELFNKGSIVYNYHRAKNEARRSGKIFLTEGVTDVIAFSKAGIDNCVCTLGTSCTKEQILLLKNTTVKLVFCYDGDDAGQRATYKAATLARKLGCNVSVIENKTGHDPDEIIRSQGPEGLKDLVSKEISWFEFIIQYLAKQTNFDNYDAKKDFVKKALAELETLEDEFDKKNYIHELEKLTGFDLQDQTQVVKEKNIVEKKHTIKTIDGLESAEETILTLMLRYKSAVDLFLNELGYLTNVENNRLAMAIVDMSRREGKIDPNKLIDLCGDVSVASLITKLMSSWMYELPYDENVMHGAIRKILIAQKQSQAKAFKEQLAQPMNEETRMLVLNEYQECLRDLRRYIDDDNR